MIHKNGSTVWMDITAEKSQESIANTFVCNYISISEDDVPYFRLHHNFLPFPDHYTDMQRQMLCANSTLLANAVNNDANMASQSPIMTSSHRSAASPSSQMARYEADPKSILRRQLIKRKLGSSLDSSFPAPMCSSEAYASGMEFFNIPPPNKMLIRRHTSSDLLYPTPGPSAAMYPNNMGYPDVQSHPIFMPPPLIREASYQPNPYEYSRAIPAPVTQEMQAPSPPRSTCSPERRHNNQNNNVMVQEDSYNNYVKCNQSPPMQSPPHEYMSQTMSPQNMQSPSNSFTGEMSPMRSPQQMPDQYPQDEFFSVVTNIVDCSQKMSSADFNNQQVPSTNIDNDLGNLISSYENQFQAPNKPTYSSCAMNAVSPPSLTHQMSPQMPQQCDVPSYPNSPNQSRLSHHIDYSQTSPKQNMHSPVHSPQMSSPQPIGSPNQGYQVNYSISSQNFPQQRGYNMGSTGMKSQHNRFVQGHNATHNGDWLRKFSHMSATVSPI